MGRNAEAGQKGGGRRRNGQRCGWVAALVLGVVAGSVLPDLDGAPVRSAWASRSEGGSASLAASWSELQLAVVGQLGRADDGDPAKATRLYSQLADRLTGDARVRLDAYWQGFQRILDLRRQRQRLTGDSLQPIGLDVRLRLQKVMGAGKPAEAGVAGDGVISMLLVQHYADHYAARHDAADAERARGELAAARRRLEELGHLPLEPATRAVVGEVGALLGSFSIAFEQWVAAVAAESRLVAQVIESGGDDFNNLVAVPAGAEPAAPVQSEQSEPQAQPETPAPAPAPVPRVTDYQLPAIVAVVSVVGPLLGGLIGWLIWRERRRVVGAERIEGTVELHAPPPEPDAAEAETEASEPEPAESESTAVAETDVRAIVAADWLAGMGRMMAALHATGGESGRSVQVSDASSQGALVEAKALAEARNRAMAAFLAILGDRLQGPLSAIVHYGDQLMGALDSRGVSELTPDVEMIQWSSEQLLRMVDALRGMAEIEAGTLAVTAEDFLVDHLVTDLHERLRPMTALYGNRFTVQAAHGIGIMHSDYAKLRTALVHLLENACKFAENGDVTLVVMRLEEGGRPVIRFTITDSGHGIAADSIERIFEPFVSFGTGRTAGAGLGLALVHRYAEALGGSITVDSTPGRGSCFVLTLAADIRVQPVLAELPGETPVLTLVRPAQADAHE